MNKFLLYHRHAASDCPATFAAWNGFRSELRRTTTSSRCTFNRHEIRSTVTAEDDRAAAAHLHNFVADRTLVVRLLTEDEWNCTDTLHPSCAAIR